MVLLAVGLCLLGATLAGPAKHHRRTRRRRRAAPPRARRRRRAAPQPASAPPGRRVRRRQVSHGMALDATGMHVDDWDVWMRDAPDALEVSLAESPEGDPEEIVANLFRRLFPRESWPPAADSPRARQFQRMVAGVGRVLERPVQPHLEVVA